MEPHRISHVHDVKCIPTHQTIPLIKSWLRLWMKPVICSLLSFLKSKQLPLLLGFLKNDFFFFCKNGILDFLYFLRHSETDTDVSSHPVHPQKSHHIHMATHWTILTEFPLSEDQIKRGITYLIHFSISPYVTVPRSTTIIWFGG